MGNCLALCDPCSGSALAQQGTIVRVTKPDGKILEFRTPVVVRQILEDFPALILCVSKEASDPLSPDHELKAGRLYYLLPNLSSPGNTNAGSGMKRVKIVITKQQLEQLVAKQISLEDVLSDVQSRTLDLPCSWRPQLDSIPEGNE
ncbi:uncharacterized protein LOC129294778 [Prosopis cineraria]|uniref:uncharacterized protein LOC129294778 n=1 Tax=Prosopis cineraria TaxID=364024 RepID=UPI00240F6AFA|nr:uncharacterized protein LOC129294778 [Prosopis cineraria]